MTENTSVTINGPAHLLEVLSQDKLIDLLRESSILVWLSAERKLLTITDSNQKVDSPYAIQLEIFPQRFPDVLPNQVNLQGNTHLLDVLLLTPTHWKSAICENETCCPIEGKTWNTGTLVSSSPEPEAEQTDFENLILLSEKTGKVPTEYLDSLNNLRVRDAWLVYLVSEPAQMDSKVSRWVEILQMTAATNQSEVLLTLRGILGYLQNDRIAAFNWISQALMIDSDYRLAQLVKRALENDAPVEIVVDSFRAVTYEKLKLRPPAAA